MGIKAPYPPSPYPPKGPYDRGFFAGPGLSSRLAEGPVKERGSAPRPVSKPTRALGVLRLFM